MIVQGTAEKVVGVYERFVEMRPEGGREIDGADGARERVLSEWKKSMDL